ncbi:MAG: hypothetical protein K0Q48_1716 [Bacillota bacterium]|jgi:epoxyqueuosine reductase|nr:hypothetical protein [Bacillota bacterium]
MNNRNLAQTIKNKALELGFEDCGIIKIEAVHDYGNKLKERLEQTPLSGPMLEYAYKYAAPEKGYDWAKSVVVCVTRYGKYQVPEHLQGMIGKYYLFDYKLQEYAQECLKHHEFEKYLGELGLKAARELNGITAARWAAYKAGLGVIRKNNFFYSEQGGSWVIIETWLIDQALELIGSSSLAECPDHCHQCIDACPTAALSQPYCTDMSRCITRLTWGLRSLPDETQRENLGKWIYGCDACQDACPMNRGKWEEIEEFPGLAELAEKITLEKLVSMEPETVAEMLTPRFWFIRRETAWLWKANALRAMGNEYQPEFGPWIQSACSSDNDNVREMAEWAFSKINMNK